MCKGRVAFLMFFLANFLIASESYEHLFANKKILITGGTGFLGRALAREILKYKPRKLVLFSRDEVKHQACLEKLDDVSVVSIIGDIRNYESIERAVAGIDIVIHAAALKRIDMMEYHVLESIYTNILGTMNVAKACLQHNVKQALLVSTDKACSPVNAYGACKFMAEKVFSYFSAQGGESKFLTVRYGNVLESTGSVIPYFCEKIRNNQNIPLTDESMTRFFIAKEQALGLIFKALQYGHGGEIFVPKLPAFRIVDLISVLRDRLGRYSDIEIIGLRPGEKLHELMINQSEATRTYEFKDMFIIMPTVGVVASDPKYVTHGKKLDKQKPFEYSSADYVLSSKELGGLLKKYDIQLSQKSRCVIR